MSTLPQIPIRDLKLSRLILGGNPISGFSHQSAERDQEMVDYFSLANIKKLFRDCEAHGVNTFFGRADHFISRVLNEYWNEGGTIQWFAQTAPERKDEIRNIRNACGWGAKGIYIHGGSVREYWDTGRRDDLKRSIDEIRNLGVPAGLASHDPNVVLEVENLGWDLDFYMVCLYNIGGYKGKIGDEARDAFDDAGRNPALKAIQHVGRPCFAYKIMGAGRKYPKEAMTEVFQYLKPTDGVVVGMFPKDKPEMVAENAALVHQLSGQVLKEKYHQ